MWKQIPVQDVLTVRRPLPVPPPGKAAGSLSFPRTGSSVLYRSVSMVTGRWKVKRRACWTFRGTMNRLQNPLAGFCSDDGLLQLLLSQEAVSARRSGMQDDFFLKFHRGGGHSRLLAPPLSIQLTHAPAEQTLGFRGRYLLSVALCLLSVPVGRQVHGAQQQVFPVRPLDDDCCHLFLFPAQGAADWFIWHLIIIIIII